jgi:hypothetical protein
MKECRKRRGRKRGMEWRKEKRKRKNMEERWKVENDGR